MHLKKEFQIEAQIVKPLLKGEEIKRYSVPDWQYYLIFPYRVENGNVSVIPEEEMRIKYPKAWEYLSENKRVLLLRDRGKLKVKWYAFSRNQNIAEFDEAKIMTQVLAHKASYTVDSKGSYYFVGGGNAGGYGIKLKPEYKLDLNYITGLLNSKLLDFYLKRSSTIFRGCFFSYAKRFIDKIPIILPNKDDTEATAKYNKICTLVNTILENNEKLKNTTDSSIRNVLERENKVNQESIDEFVYELIGLKDVTERNAVD